MYVLLNSNTTFPGVSWSSWHRLTRLLRLHDRGHHGLHYPRRLQPAPHLWISKKLQALTFACVENTILFDTPNQYRYYFIPWLVVYMLSIIGLMIGAMVIIVYFAIIFPIPSIAALCVIPILSGLILLYWWLMMGDTWIDKKSCVVRWMVVNGRFISLGLSEVTSLGAAGQWAWANLIRLESLS